MFAALTMASTASVVMSADHDLEPRRPDLGGKQRSLHCVNLVIAAALDQTRQRRVCYRPRTAAKSGRQSGTAQGGPMQSFATRIAIAAVAFAALPAAGRRRRLADAADPHDGRLRRRRRHRCRHPHRRGTAGRGPRPAHRGREQARRRRHHRRRSRRQGDQGRLQRADDLDRPHGVRGDDQVAGLRRGEGFHAGRHHRQLRHRCRRAEGLACERSARA